MERIEILSLPEVLFAHIFEAKSYYNRFPAKKDFIEVTYIAEGEVEYVVKNKKNFAKKGDVVCLLHNEDSEIFTKDYHCHHTVGFSADWLFSKDGGACFPTITPASGNTAEIYRLIDELVYGEVDYKSSKVHGAAKLLELVCAVDKCNRKISVQNLPGEVMYTEQAKKYIHENINSAITQGEIAKKLGISPEYLCAIFKKTEGTTIKKYVNKLKLEGIKALLDHTSLHLYEAASVYGYNDPNYVSRLYKKTFGYNITDKPKSWQEEG